MASPRILTFYLAVLSLCFTPGSNLTAQFLRDIVWNENGLVKSYVFDDGAEIGPRDDIPLVTLVLNDSMYSIRNADKQGDSWVLENKLKIEFKPAAQLPGRFGTFTFSNLTEDTLTLENIVLFGAVDGRYHITGYGDHWLSRTRLFRPQQSSVPVILPDNAWELGYSDVPLNDPGIRVCGLIRRSSWENAKKRRFETFLFENGQVTYEAYAESYTGSWQEGLRLMFQDRFLYDLEKFDLSMYDRDDLKWIRNKYIIHLMMAWDHWYYDEITGTFGIRQFLDRGRQLYGGDDIIGLWPTWPALGMDQRNQWDHFRDLPGGIMGLRKLVDDLHTQDVRFFICYNPWDESTRFENHLTGMAQLIRDLDADGVVLDTRGSSSHAIQRAADSVRSGVMMYSEGMAVPKDMPGIVSGRVHNALYYPPLLNLNKLIKPDFAIFRVAELKYERIRREYNISLFNGHGVEINMFSPGQPGWVEEDYKYLGKIARILRENSSNFNGKDFTPLVYSMLDSVYINYWPGEPKDIYTLYSLRPEGVNDIIFGIDPEADHHVIDLWNHEEISIADGKVNVKLDAFHKSWIGTNNEGSVSAIAIFPELLDAKISGNDLLINAPAGDAILIWKGNPGYSGSPITLQAGNHAVSLAEYFRRYEGKLVIQLKKGNSLTDERVLNIKPGTPFLTSKFENTERAGSTPEGMVKIHSGVFKWITANGDDFIEYPETDTIALYEMQEFFMDKYPVTNVEFRVFLEESKYVPSDTTNFLRHWKNGRIPSGQEQFPVVFVSYNDARAYAKWAGKRLPTELEWQYAAQTGDGRMWPWGAEMDSTMTNMGDGVAYPVGQFLKASNPWGLEDLVGQVWQLTHDRYESGSYTYVIVKGGSFFRPTSSWWYVQGGPQPLPHRQMLLQVSDGFDRKATVGFRCVKDAR